MSEHAERQEVGAYLLGGLEPRARGEFEAHLASCEVCRSEVADLAGLPALLGRLSTDEVLATPPPLPERPLPAHRGRRWSVPRPALLAAAAAIVVALVGGILGLSGALSSGRHGAPTSVHATLVATTDPASGVAELSATPKGSAVSVQVRGIRQGQRCALVLLTTSGTREQVATWVADYEGSAQVRTASDLAPADVRTVVVEAASDHRTLLAGDAHAG